MSRLWTRVFPLLVAVAFPFGVAGSAQPTCVSTSQSPDSTLNPVDPGTVITLSLVTSGAVSAEISGVPTTPTGADQWQVTHTAVVDTTIIALISDAGGMTEQCSWVIDVDCVDPMLTFVADPTSNGIEVSGTPGCVYAARVTDSLGSTDYEVFVNSSGFGSVDAVVPYDALIEVGQAGLPVVADSIRTAAAPLVAVPALESFGIAMFALLLAGFALRSIHRV